MIAITDTHTLLWLDSDPARSSPALARYLNSGRTVYVSVVNPWEVLIKVRNGKLRLRADIDTIIADQMSIHRTIRILPIDYRHVLEVGNLPLAHRDPFDRMLAAQTIVENATLITNDAIFQQYPTVRTDW